jgi:hypothetical protein
MNMTEVKGASDTSNDPEELNVARSTEILRRFVQTGDIESYLRSVQSGIKAYLSSTTSGVTLSFGHRSETTPLSLPNGASKPVQY